MKLDMFCLLFAISLADMKSGPLIWEKTLIKESKQSSIAQYKFSIYNNDGRVWRHFGIENLWDSSIMYINVEFES